MSETVKGESPPAIHVVTCEGGCIRVVATDNVQVTNVRITITDESGQLVEQGQAKLMDDPWWEYAAASLEGSVTVEAFDPAGNVTAHSA